ncbi:hypothetical protein [Crocosphaera chwakensis]|uniref:3-oxoacyl-(Acyl carrier protein) synthase n=1 Tax=Crocosphaera chwakensis CCY0110 TaxID=391612 RepID=A3IWV0_9CHRO|nr:hypothetical protein [Crocosphaera chwakensis]EAZ89052.1 3-oxoacyl-(acyl carrier protein) synthase [Crocosphaera chwakensis CCY0110]
MVLLTTLAVNNLAETQKVLKYYTYRWLIERFHYVLKTGCGIEMFNKIGRTSYHFASLPQAAWVCGTIIVNSETQEREWQ